MCDEENIIKHFMEAKLTNICKNTKMQIKLLDSFTHILSFIFKFQIQLLSRACNNSLRSNLVQIQVILFSVSEALIESVNLRRRAAIYNSTATWLIPDNQREQLKSKTENTQERKVSHQHTLGAHLRCAIRGGFPVTDRIDEKTNVYSLCLRERRIWCGRHCNGSVIILSLKLQFFVCHGPRVHNVSSQF
ncbi:Hypothetical_protein [Hexamita inflata]|uniref:Hypothetical_protein n=1 Tax=Hexamita inflata TaxID=28002 RepID=A0AA86R6U9_9EUKA|nr:Hypothetical protein HINF_LOCUS60409 [Hexamita inflata]